MIWYLLIQIIAILEYYAAQQDEGLILLLLKGYTATFLLKLPLPGKPLYEKVLVKREEVLPLLSAHG